MASPHEEEAEVEALKKWWNENWVALATGLVIGLGAIFGWQGWTRYQTAQRLEASQIYEDLKNAYATNHAHDVPPMGERLQKEFAGTPYAAAGTLHMAAQSVTAGQLEEARKHLDWVIKSSGDEGLRQLAQLRQARVLWALGQNDDALKLLDATPGVYAALYEEARGDILLAKGDRAAAFKAYEKALSVATEDDRAVRESLRRKLDDLADVAQS